MAGLGWSSCPDIERFGPDGAAMKDGPVKPADLIVLATGYEGQAGAARRILGDEVGDRVGRVWAATRKVSCRACRGPPGRRGFRSTPAGWPSAASFREVLALQIMARELGITR